MDSSGELQDHMQADCQPAAVQPEQSHPRWELVMLDPLAQVANPYILVENVWDCLPAQHRHMWAEIVANLGQGASLQSTTARPG